MIGRKSSNYIIESLDHSVCLDVPSIIECSDIPNNREEIPSPEVVANHPHLKDLTSHILPIDLNTNIEILIGRDVISAHHVLDQRLGGDSVPYAQKLPLGWVVIGESCLGKVHRKETICVNKTCVLPNGRATFLHPCENAFIVKEDTIFRKTSLDETPGSSIEDKLFLKHMSTKVALDSEGHWQAPLPFRENRQVLPNNIISSEANRVFGP